MSNVRRSRQRGMVLVTSLLLLVVVTILALGMFHSFGLDEKIAGNLRDKQLALNAAESAEQYAEWWLANGNGQSSIVCNSVVAYTVGQTCTNALPTVVGNVASVPWKDASGNLIGVSYTPPNLGVTNNTTFSQTPVFYISNLGDDDRAERQPGDDLPDRRRRLRRQREYRRGRRKYLSRDTQHPNGAMMNTKPILAAAILLSAGLARVAAPAQTNYTENFTGATTNNSWYFSNGACLTASTSAGTASPGQIPGCVSMTSAGGYYAGVTLKGGNTGTLPDDPLVGGALRFTNNNNSQHGAIISNFSFPIGQQGLKVQFTTETYEGDSGGSGKDGADGISFFLQDASKVNLSDPVAASASGDWGGSLAYTCSNVNNDSVTGYDGIVGGYIGLGIDEYGNFLNPGDNTTYRSGYQWNRIGLRGSGSTAWSYLTAAYPTWYPSTSVDLAAAQRGAEYLQDRLRLGLQQVPGRRS